MKVEWRYHVIVKIYYEGPVGCEGCKERTAAVAARWTELERIEGNCTARGETAVWSICDPLMSSLRIAERRVFMHIIWLSAVTKLPLASTSYQVAPVDRDGRVGGRVRKLTKTDSADVLKKNSRVVDDVFVVIVVVAVVVVCIYRAGTTGPELCWYTTVPQRQKTVLYAQRTVYTWQTRTIISLSSSATSLYNTGRLGLFWKF